MSSLNWMFVCLLTCFLSRSVSEASEKAKKLKTGEDVILHCQVPTDADIELLEWIRPDLKSDEYVFFFREKQSYEDYQHPDFHGRVELVDPEMKDGDFSVRLKNVTIDDSGPYECRVGKNHSGSSKRETPELINSVTLNVDSVWRYMEAHTGENITLPCPTLSTSPVTAVKWTMRNKKDYVFQYPDKQFGPDNQHPYYKNWVELKDSEMKDGDASLILEDVMNIDSGTYECSVSDRGTNHKTSIINLYVYPPGGDKHEGDKNGTNKGGGDYRGYVGLGICLSFVLLITVVSFFLKYLKPILHKLKKLKQYKCPADEAGVHQLV